MKHILYWEKNEVHKLVITQNHMSNTKPTIFIHSGYKIPGFMFGFGVNFGDSSCHHVQ